jgi:chromosome segregation ATPase
MAGRKRTTYPGLAGGGTLFFFGGSLILIMPPPIGKTSRENPMSLLSFTKCFISAGGEQAATALTTAMVKMSPEAATAAELKKMEQDLDAAGQLISQLQRELTDERHAYDAINARYTQMMGAAENLQHQIDAASFLKDPLQASLATLVAQIEEMVPELDQDKKDIDSTQTLLAEAEVAYRAKATALREAKAKLTRAKNDMAHAAVEEQRAAWRAETARAVAGLSSSSGINVAVDAMTQTAQATRDRAATLDMKAKALSGAKAAEEDPNIAAAMAAAAGTVANATVADRLAALQQRK